MSERVLRLARDLTLPLEMVTEATGIVATRGAGKSSASAVVIEEVFELGVQVVVFDRTGVYWGLRSNAKGTGPGLGVYVLGGPHGDVPLETSAGGLIADLVVDSGHSFVLDLSDFSKSAAIRFSADFLERLYDRKARARSTTLLVLDEAHFYAPQTPRGGFKGDAARLMGAMEDVVGLGRSRGLGAIVTTQRTQSLNKAILDLIETLVVMRMLSPRARKAVQEWIQEKHEDDREGVIASLDSLPTGTAWVWSPLRGILKRVALRRIRTFDSYYAPRPGETPIEPQARKSLDLDALGEQMRATAERAKADDPQELRRRIRELEAQLASRPAEAERVEVVVPVEVRVPYVPDELVAGLDPVYEALARIIADSTLGHGKIDELRESFRGYVGEAERAVQRSPDAAPSAVPPASAATSPPSRPAPVRPSVPSAQTNGGSQALSRRANRAVLAVLAQFPAGRTKTQLALQTGYSSGGGGFNNAIAALRSAGYLEQRADTYVATSDGLAAIAGQYEPLPAGRALLDHWLGQMKRRADRTILDVLAAHPDRTFEKDELAALAGYEASGGGFNNALAKLRTLELITGRGEVRLSPEFAEAIR